MIAALARWLGLWQPRTVRLGWDTALYLERLEEERRDREQPWLRYRY